MNILQHYDIMYVLICIVSNHVKALEILACPQREETHRAKQVSVPHADSLQLGSPDASRVGPGKAATVQVSTPTK